MNLDLTDQQKAWLEQVTDFANSRVAPRAASIDEEARFPRDLVAEAAKLGLMGVTIPRELGGRGSITSATRSVSRRWRERARSSRSSLR